MKVHYLFSFIILTLIYFSIQEDSQLSTLEIDSENCINSNYENCEDVVIKTPGHICCQINEETSITQRQTCKIKTTKEEQNKLVGSSFIINKELGGVQIYNEKYSGVTGNITEREEKLRRDITINCYEWDLFLKLINVEDYTPQDISILQSENHCLTYFNSFLIPTEKNKREVTKETCFNALLLPSTKRSGISCGYMEIDIENQILLKVLKHAFYMTRKLFKLVF